MEKQKNILFRDIPRAQLMGIGAAAALQLLGLVVAVKTGDPKVGSQLAFAFMFVAWLGVCPAVTWWFERSSQRR